MASNTCAKTKIKINFIKQNIYMSIIRDIYERSALLKWAWRKYVNHKRMRYLHNDPRPLINAEYKSVFGKNIDWNNPKDLIEKIDWLQVYSDTSLWTLCADKYRVREYVKNKGCSEILNELYGVWDKPEDIEWDKLPDSFVMKTNNSCGQILIVRDKETFDKTEAIRNLTEWMRAPYGIHNAQMHYIRIEPCIIAEKLLIDNANPDTSLVDYKIWCFHGKPECILVAYDRGIGHYSLSMYDTSWNNISEEALNKQSVHYCGHECAKPASFEQMLEYAKKLSVDFPEVRVDFYEVNGKPVFGELTFTTGFGSYNKEFYNRLGAKVDLNRVKRLGSINTL